MVQSQAMRDLHVFVCTKEGPLRCADLGSEALLRALRTKVQEQGLANVRTTRMGCNHQHHQGPIIIIYPDGVWYGNLKLSDIDRIVDEHLVNGNPVEALRIIPT